MKEINLWLIGDDHSSKKNSRNSKNKEFRRIGLFPFPDRELIELDEKQGTQPDDEEKDDWKNIQFQNIMSRHSVFGHIIIRNKAFGIKYKIFIRL